MFKKILLFCSLLVGFNYAYAGSVIVHKKTIELPVDISSAKLKWTSLGYGGRFFVKIIVPDLAVDTLLNHRNEGEDGPCLFTYGTNEINDVIQDNPEIINATFDIELEKSTFLDEASGLCNVSLTESVKTEIRGFEFIHSRVEKLPSRHSDDCK